MITGNTIVATLVIGMAMCAALCDLLSDRGESRWPTLPAFIRWEFRVTALAFLVRGVDLYSISSPRLQLGQVNFWAALASVCLFVTVVSLTGYALSLRLPLRAWDRLRFARATMKENPSAIPLMLTPDRIVEIARAEGRAGVGPEAAPVDVVSEAPRFMDAIAREHQA